MTTHEMAGAILPERTAAKCDRPFFLTLIAGVVLLHIAALFTFGATFWVDSGIYATLGDALFSAKRLRLFYGPSGLLTYSHFSMAEPALWSFLSHLPVAWQWPALAVGQHGVAAASVCWLWGTAYRIWPSWWHLAGAVAVSLHPFYQAFHNALMTESLSTSLLLLALGLALRLMFIGWSWRRYLLLLVLLVAAAQFRTYSGLMLAGFAALAFWQQRKVARWPALVALAVACFCGALLFPVYRLALTGKWLLPSLGTNSLVFARWSNPAPSTSLLERLRAPGYLSTSESTIFWRENFNYDRASEIGAGWLAAGATPPEINKRVSMIVKAVEEDRSRLFTLKIRYALSSCGFSWSAFLGPDRGPVYQSRSIPEQQQFRLGHFRWLMWVKQPSYRAEAQPYLRNFRTPLPNSSRVQKALYAAVEPYLANCSPRWRDPLGFGMLIPDVFAVLGLVGIALCLWRRPPLGLVLLGPLIVNFAVMLAAAVGGPRYAYCLWPLYFFAFSTGLVLLRADRAAAAKSLPLTAS